MLWRFLRLSSTNWPAATAPSSTRHCRLVSAYIGRTFTRRARADRGRSSVCRECPGFQKCVDQGLKFPRHNGVGHHLKGEDAMCLASSRNSLEAGGTRVTTAAAKARQRPARNSMGSRRCAFLDSAARRPHSSARSRHCSRVLGGMARRASFPFLTSGSTVASLGRRSPERIEPAIADLAATIPLPQHSKTCGWALPIRRGRR